MYKVPLERIKSCYLWLRRNFTFYSKIGWGILIYGNNPNQFFYEK